MSFSELEDLDQIQTQQLMMMQDETQYLDPEIYAEQSMHEEDTSRDLFEDNWNAEESIIFIHSFLNEKFLIQFFLSITWTLTLPMWLKFAVVFCYF